MSDEPEDYDLLAALYVLGSMEPEEAHAFEALVQEYEGLAVAVETWRNRLAPLAAAATPARPPSAVWERVTATLGMKAAGPDPLSEPVEEPEPPPPVNALMRTWGSLGFWRLATAGALALAAVFAGIAFFGHAAPPAYVAALSPVNAPAPVFLASMERNGSLLIAPLARAAVPNGKDLELWALPEGEKQPRSLGVIPAIGKRIAAANLPAPGTKLLVSLEPAGGSPTGQPTGQVLYGGTLSRAQ